MFNSSESASNGIKMIRFFRIVSVLGGLVLLAHILLFIAISGWVWQLNSRDISKLKLPGVASR